MKIQAVKDILRVRIVIPGGVAMLTIEEAREHACQVLASVKELEEIPLREQLISSLAINAAAGFLIDMLHAKSQDWDDFPERAADLARDPLFMYLVPELSDKEREKAAETAAWWARKAVEQAGLQKL